MKNKQPEEDWKEGLKKGRYGYVMDVNAVIQFISQKRAEWIAEGYKKGLDDGNGCPDIGCENCSTLRDQLTPKEGNAE